MQYPMRDVSSLQAVLGTGKGIIFVENKENFEAALARGPVSSVFRDMFAGDFGHATPAGNALIAENAARAILREVFGRSPKRIMAPNG
jgi:hypothetical protein